MFFISTVHLADEGIPLCKNANKCKIDVTITKEQKKTERAMFLTQYFSRRRQKSKSQLSIYIVRLEFQRIETGISARRNCSFSIVKLESHFAGINWYWAKAIYLALVSYRTYVRYLNLRILRSLTTYRDDIALRVNYYVIKISVWMLRLQTFFHTLTYINQRGGSCGATPRLL